MTKKALVDIEAPNGEQPRAVAMKGRSNGAATMRNRTALQRMLKCLSSVRSGTFSVRLPSDWTGIEGKVADAINEIITTNERMARELRRVSRMVGKQGKIGQRASFSAAGGAWQGME